MKKAFSVFDRIIELIEDIVCVGTLAGIICITGVQVVLRYFFHTGILWSDEVNQALMVALGMFGCAKAIRVKGHTELTLLVSHLKTLRSRRILRLFTNIAAVGILLFLFVVSLQYTLNSTTIRSVTLRVPRMYYYMSMPIGLGLSCYEFLKQVKTRIMDDVVEEY